MREKLHRADHLLKLDRVPEAAAIYEEVATEYERAGFVLKAIALRKQLLELATTHAGSLKGVRARSLVALASLYVMVGLDDDAEKMRQELTREDTRLLH